MDGFQRELDVYQSRLASVFDAAGEGLRESRVITGLPLGSWGRWSPFLN